MATLSVRLSDVDVRAVHELKRQGLSVSDIVRGVIHARAAECVLPLDTDRVLSEMVRRFPARGRASTVDATGRGAVQRAIRERLTKRRR